MGKNQINVALLGLGRIGQMHAENLINHKSFKLKYTFESTKKEYVSDNNNLSYPILAKIG